MKDDSEGSKAEIVIVRRRGSDDSTATKAGAWKIAYADFVTAMMAFFLVMWLINASNEETRSQVASYFNPIKLTDNSTGAKSIKDLKDTRNVVSERSGETDEGRPPSSKDVRDEGEVLADPLNVLARVAAKADSISERTSEAGQVEVSPSSAPRMDIPGLGDPFDPSNWEQRGQSPVGEAGDETSQATIRQNLARDEHSSAGSSSSDDERRTEGNAELRADREAEILATDIENRLSGASEGVRRSVEVRNTSQGVLISLTENANFEMFKSGSAEPGAAMLGLVRSVATALQNRPGMVVIRGHTDARPYRNKYYDNWQLSSARANFARYMLIRGGLDERRVIRVEGVADREPKNPKDPQAPENRRIEIFVQEHFR